MASDEKIAHLQMIQAVIARLASESATMKRFAMGIAGAGVLAQIAAQPVWVPCAASAVLIAILWVLDGSYLMRERAFRDCYRTAAADVSQPCTFAIAPPPGSIGFKRWASAAFGPTVWPLYAALIVVTALVGGLRP